MIETTSAEALFNPGKATDFFCIDALPPFEPTLSAFHPGNAIWLMECSRTIYCDDTARRRDYFITRAQMEEKEFFSGHITRGAFLRGPGFGVLVFRGTLGFRDFLADLDIAPIVWQGQGRVHKGFCDQLNPIWERISAILDAASVPIFFTGHSLGGALAMLAGARRLAEGKSLPAAIYSFGSPRVGTAEFIATLSEDLPHHRVINGRDIIATLPPPRLGLPLFQYRHGGMPRFMDGLGPIRELAHNVDEEAEDTALEGLKKRWSQARQHWQEVIDTRGASLAAPFLDHAPANYTARLEKLLPHRPS